MGTQQHATLLQESMLFHHYLERGCLEVVAYIFIIAKREGYCQGVILDTTESIITTLREGV